MHLALRESLAFVARWLPAGSRVVDVGCGHGGLAAALAAQGHLVTGVDLCLHPHRPPGVRFVETDFLAFDSAPVDAVIMVASLHHIAPVADAVARAARMLAPAGVLIVDDFAVEAPDAATARWYYDTQELLAAAGMFPRDHVRGDPGDDPVARWQAEHAHDVPLTPGADMAAAIAARLAVVHHERGPYLYRYIDAGVTHAGGPRADAIAEHALAVERRRIRAGTLVPVGLRIVARRVASHSP